MAIGEHIATAYLVLVPDIYDWPPGTTRVRKIRVDRMRTSKPALFKGEVAVKVNLTIKDEEIIDAIPIVDANVSFGMMVAPSISVGAAK